MKAQLRSCVCFVLGAAQALYAQTGVGLVTFEPEVLVLDADGKIPTKVKDKKVPEKDKDKKPPEKKDAPKSDIFTSTLPQAMAMPTYFNPQMMGNNPPVVSQISSPSPVLTVSQAKQQGATLFPAFSHAAFNIAENETPMPTDRIFAYYNFYGAALAGNVPLVVSDSVGNRAVIAPQRVDLNREVIGFEKTFLGGAASIEVRVPFLQQRDAGPGFGSNDNVGDLTFVTKYALFVNRETGNVFSTGLAVTVPTGPGIQTSDGAIRDTIFQPWIGYIWNADYFYIQGFHAIAVPTDNRDVTIVFNDLGLYFWLSRTPERFVNFIVPCVEAHVTTPVNHRDSTSDFFVPDTVTITTGVHVGLGRSILSVGVATPVTGPRPYNIEAFAQLNCRF
jgi:hypothetical protein